MKNYLADRTKLIDASGIRKVFALAAQLSDPVNLSIGQPDYDVDEAVNAARAVGDDILMEKAGRAPMPDSFTHGSAADRSAWLMRGMRSGQIADCDSVAGAGR